MNELVVSRKSGLIAKEDYAHYMQMSNVFADSDLVPEHFKKKPQNVFLALQMAERLDIDPMLAIQNIHIIKGKPALSSQMLIALINNSGLIDGVIQFTSNGKPPPELAVIATAKLKNGDTISSSFCFQQAIAMGVTGNAPWKTAPELMCRYRAASHLARSYFPHLTLGLGNKEELEELDPINVTPRVGESKVNQLLAKEAPQTQPEIVEPTETPRRRGRPPKTQTESIPAQQYIEVDFSQPEPEAESVKIVQPDEDLGW